MASWLAPSVPAAGRPGPACIGNGEQQVLGRDELVLKAAGFVECAFEHLIHRLREVHPRGGMPETLGMSLIMRSASAMIASG